MKQQFSKSSFFQILLIYLIAVVAYSNPISSDSTDTNNENEISDSTKHTSTPIVVLSSNNDKNVKDRKIKKENEEEECKVSTNRKVIGIEESDEKEVEVNDYIVPIEPFKLLLLAGDEEVEDEEVEDEEVEDEEVEDEEVEDEEEEDEVEYKSLIKMAERISYNKCTDVDERCELLADMGECDENPTYMLRNCESSCDCIRGDPDVGVDQAIVGDEKEEETLEVITSSILYYETEVLGKKEKEGAEVKCSNMHMLCSYWSSKGDCEGKEERMRRDCSLACQTCAAEEDKDYLDGCVDLIDQCEELKEAERCFYIDVIPVCRKTCNNCVAQSDYGVPQAFDSLKEEALEKLYKESVAFFEEEIVYYPEFPRIRERCQNLNSLCTFWASTEECGTNPEFMNANCPLACKTCLDLEVPTDLHCKDDHEFCEGWARENKCASDAEYMQFYCAKTCKSCILQYDIGMDQVLLKDQEREIHQLVQQTGDYYVQEVLTKSEFVMVRRECKNRHEMCTAWAVKGECTKNQYFMSKHCPIACKSCLHLDVKHRCPLDLPEDAPPVWRKGKGDLNSMFMRIISLAEEVQQDSDHNQEPRQKFTPTIHSKPKQVELPPQFQTENILNGPWILSLDNFITIDEADRLIEYGHLYGYTRSSNVGAQKWDGSFKAIEDKSRTSTNSWCNSQCRNDPLVISIIERMEYITNITSSNHETLQLLKYEEGQFYKSHHDYIPHQVQRQYGPRIITIFLYLNDVPEGGETKFNTLNITITPKKGRAVIWPSVLGDFDPTMMDPRTDHEALLVKKGIKYGANVWIHLGDIQKAIQRGCE